MKCPHYKISNFYFQIQNDFIWCVFVWGGSGSLDTALSQSKPMLTKNAFVRTSFYFYFF